ncbi:soluble calcium-activated nucleotidase [Anaeramoeba flamelloides]|uniref:Soluble calcium-activated nucleotidase n=1 Tax=Anaeramoeba flamelloides TaxID=1746091 RepID=A0AAV7YAU4_9EUKA|nr:soluble calcium-activated nucleotidase [Anaeramoeba flamelloides]
MNRLKKIELKNNPRVIGCIAILILFLFSLTITTNIKNAKMIGTVRDKYTIGIISDLDKKSKLVTEKHTWISYFNQGTLTRNPDDTYSLVWEKETPLRGHIAESDRGMELSELIKWNGMLLAFDDRSGIGYEIKEKSVVPKYILTTGDGNQPKGFKCEWATIKDDVLYVGSIGKEFTDNGKIVNYNHCYVKKIYKSGEIVHEDWTDKYNVIREITNSKFPGYQVHEAVNWSPRYKRWFFLPRRISEEAYDENKDEHKGSNKMITVNSRFKKLEIDEITDFNPEKGFSSFKFVPGRPDEMVILKTVEVDDKTESYISVVNFLNKKILLPETKIGSWGQNIDGYPYMDERGALCGINWCRLDKDYFAANVLSSPSILQASFYQNTKPLYWNVKLAKAARGHSEYMASNNCFGHNTCGDSTFDERVTDQGYTWNYVGESIAGYYPYNNAIQFVKNLVCEDGDHSNCEPDSNLDSIGHRNNTMSENFVEVGNGVAYDETSDIKNYYTESFASRSDWSEPNHPVASAAHIVDSSNNFFFILNYYEPNSPGSDPTWVYVNYLEDGQSTWNTYQMSEISMGTYTYSMTKPTSCDTYFFMVKDSQGDIWRYPEGQDLVTSDGFLSDNICGSTNYITNNCDPSLDCNGYGACKSSGVCACMNGAVTNDCDGCSDSAPVYNTNSLLEQTIDFDESLNYQFASNAFSGTNLEYSAKQSNGQDLPGSISFNSDTRTFSGTVDDECSTTYTIKVTATNCGGSDEGTFDLIIQNDKPTIENAVSDQTKSITAQSTLDVSNTFDDPEGETLTLSSKLTSGSDLPSWLTFDSSAKEYSKTSTTGCGQTIEVSLKADDSCGTNTVEETFKFTTTNDKPTIENAVSDQTKSITTQSTIDVSNTFDDPEGETLTLSSKLTSGSNLPSWLTFDSSAKEYSKTSTTGCGQTIEVSLKADDSCGTNTVEDIFQFTTTNDKPTIENAVSDQTKSITTQSTIDVSNTFDDPEGETLTLSSKLTSGSDLPSWFTFDSSAKEYSKTSTTGCGQTIEVSLKADDSCGTNTVEETFKFTTTNDKPTIENAVSDQTKSINAQSTLDVSNTFDDPEGETLTLSSKLTSGSNLPSWLTFDSSAKEYSKTSTTGCGQTIEVSLKADDSCGTNTVEDIFQFTTTNDKPTIENAVSDQTKSINAQYTIDVSNTFDDPEGETLTLSSKLSSGSDLPSWFVFDSNAKEYTAAVQSSDCGQTIEVSLQADDSCGTNTVEDIFKFTTTNEPPSLDSQKDLEDQTAHSLKQFSYQFDDDIFIDLEEVQLTFSAKQFNDEDLPDWLAFNSNQRKFSGIPTKTCETISYEIKVTASDGCNDVSSTFALEVVNENPILNTPIDNNSHNKSTAFDFTIPEDTFTDPEEQTLTYTATLENGDPLPDWMTFTASTQNFQGTSPDENGEWSIKVTATDDCDASVSDVFDFAVASDAPELENEIPDQEADTNTQNWQYVFPEDTFAGMGISYTATLVSGTELPDWLNFVSATREFSGNIPEGCEKTWDIKVDAKNNKGSDFTVFKLSKVNEEPTIKDLGSKEILQKKDFSITFENNEFVDPENQQLNFTVTLDDNTELPDWLIWDSENLNFSGTAPDDTEEYKIKFVVNDDCPDNEQTANYIIKVVTEYSDSSPSTTNDAKGLFASSLLLLLSLFFLFN